MKILSPWALFLRFYDAERRTIDIMVLWPSLKRQANEPENIAKAEAKFGGPIDTLELARAAFASHALKDGPWIRLGYDEMLRRIEALK